jgi:hypothetical protein
VPWIELAPQWALPSTTAMCTGLALNTRNPINEAIDFKNRALARFFFAYSTGQLQQMLHHFRLVSVSLAYV